MKFLIQKINNQIRHDFAFTLIESVRFHNWLNHGQVIMVRYMHTETNDNDETLPFKFLKYHHSYVPIGTVEFVSQFLEHFHGLTPKPINVPPQLYQFAQRNIFVGSNTDLDGLKGWWFIKNHEKIKDPATYAINPVASCVPADCAYQISSHVTIDSEWRSFVYKGKLVGLQHYLGEFTLFPDVSQIKRMIEAYKDAPIAYTLDVGINDKGTFVIEVHDLFSCGLYGFSDHSILPSMFNRWFREYIDKNKIK